MNVLKYLPYIFHIVYFNFRYLPFKQALVLPILLYKPKLLRMKGKVTIESNRIKTGMIRLGCYNVSLYPDAGIVWENHGGHVIFKSSCSIGNASAISIGQKGKLYFGTGFHSNSLKIACYKSISIGDYVRMGWDCLIIDTNFHRTKRINGEASPAFGSIRIGKNNWIGLKCTVMKGTETPDYTIVAGNSVINKKYDIPEYSLIAGSPAKLKFTGIYRDLADDDIDY